MFKHIAEELKEHASFTVFSTMTGIVIMVIFPNMPQDLTFNNFYGGL